MHLLLCAEWAFYCCTVPRSLGTAQTGAVFRALKGEERENLCAQRVTRAASNGAFGHSLFSGSAFIGNVCG